MLLKVVMDYVLKDGFTLFEVFMLKGTLTIYYRYTQVVFR